MEQTIPILHLIDHRAGVNAQSRGLIEALSDLRSLSIHELSVGRIADWRAVVAHAFPAVAIARNTDIPIDVSKPAMVIGCGRHAAAFSAGLGSRHPSVFSIHLQKPPYPPDRYNVVIAPSHDALHGDNVISSLGALGSVRPESVRLASQDLPAAWGGAGPKILAVLIGGDSKAHVFTRQAQNSLLESVKSLSGAGWRLRITLSRRSPSYLKESLRRDFQGRDCSVYDPETDQGQNPYPGMLNGAAAALVTGDSTNLISEAVSARVPTLIFHVPKRRFGSNKFEVFYRDLLGQGLAKPFEGSIEQWALPEFNEARRIAPIVLDRFDQFSRAFSG
ncbi:MAG: mitochondrial fission ELM1 family protein [Pseudomonadota bacterium]